MSTHWGCGFWSTHRGILDKTPVLLRSPTAPGARWGWCVGTQVMSIMIPTTCCDYLEVPIGSTNWKWPSDSRFSSLEQSVDPRSA
jgi:hypothetical protein